jgi:hypothetical protein
MSQEWNYFDAAIATVLESVKLFSHPDLPNGIGLIELSFPKCKVFVGIEDEYDTLLCSSVVLKTHVAYTCSISSSFWDPAIGKSLVGAWQMTNDRGYPDAIQLRFRELANAGLYTIIQLYGEASQITMTELKELREVSISHSGD